MSLRARLTLGLIVLATAGVATIDVVSYTSLRTFLLDRADQTLNDANRSVMRVLQENPDSLAGDPENVKTSLAGLMSRLVGSIQGNCLQMRSPQNIVVKVVAPSSSIDCLPAQQGATLPPPPAYPARVSVPSKPNADGERVRYLTVPAQPVASSVVVGSTGAHGPTGVTPAIPVAGSEPLTEYRVRVSVEPQSKFYFLVATPLRGVHDTLHRLLVIELLVSAGVLGALAVLGLALVRLGLRPLESIGRTATAIAGGDLSRRVEQVDEKTEVGRLGRLLNTMLGQIEAAFQSREAALQAREASEAKLRRFVADASHELRTPVAAVRAYAELFSRGAAEQPEDLERLMEGVMQASERMSALVDELFLLAHLDEGRALAHEAVDLESVVAEAVEVERALEPDRPVRVETRPTVVVGDRSRLRQLVDNLLSNVRGHTPPETPVTVRLEHDGANAVLRVTDSGPGIDEESLPHVFERFYRAEAAHTRSGGGSGLGLAIVAALAEAHGGSAAVSSALGEGATFTITLPLAPIDNGDRASAPGEPASIAELTEH